jgi:hypothetical protein
MRSPADPSFYPARQPSRGVPHRSRLDGPQTAACRVCAPPAGLLPTTPSPDIIFSRCIAASGSRIYRRPGGRAPRLHVRLPYHQVSRPPAELAGRRRVASFRTVASRSALHLPTPPATAGLVSLLGSTPSASTCSAPSSSARSSHALRCCSRFRSTEQLQQLASIYRNAAASFHTRIQTSTTSHHTTRFC